MNINQAKSQLKTVSTVAPVYGKKIFKFAGLFFGLVILLSLLIYIASLFFAPEVFTKPQVIPEYHVISFARKDMSERDVLAKFGRSTVIGVSDSAYRLKLNNEKFEEFKSLNLTYTELPDQFLVSRNGFAIYRVEFYPPVYSSKVQAIANFGSIVQENKNETYLFWADKTGAEKVAAIDTVKSITPYLAYEKIGIDLNARLREPSFQAKIKVLIIGNNVEAVRKTVESYGMKITEEEDAFFIDESLSTVVLSVDTDFDKLVRVLTTFPQLISIE